MTPAPCRRFLLFTATALCLAWALIPGTAPAQRVSDLPPQAPLDMAGLSAADRADIARIEAYFDSLHTLAARFYQVSSSGDLAEGMLYLSRPGKMRVEYKPPSPLLIVADGRKLVYYDAELKSANTYRIEDTPAGFLLRQNLDIGGDVAIAGFERRKGVLRLTLIDPENPDIGSVTLSFTARPLVLKKWQIRDPQGVVTTVALLDPVTDIELEARLFVFEDPEGLYKPFAN